MGKWPFKWGKKWKIAEQAKWEKTLKYAKLQVRKNEEKMGKSGNEQQKFFKNSKKPLYDLRKIKSLKVAKLQIKHTALWDKTLKRCYQLIKCVENKENRNKGPPKAPKGCKESQNALLFVQAGHKKVPIPL